jgi:hypothetical protein
MVDVRRSGTRAAFGGTSGVNRFGFIGALVALVLSAGAAAAQSDAPPVINPAGDNAIIRSEVHADIVAARGQEKSAAATRQQIQAIRAALRAKLTALHH